MDYIQEANERAKQWYYDSYDRLVEAGTINPQEINPCDFDPDMFNTGQDYVSEMNRRLAWQRYDMKKREELEESSSDSQ